MMMSSSLAHALGMGEIEVDTSLNEPLDAKIKLFSATPGELSSLKVEMASKDVFSRLGIDRLPILLDLEFELVSTGEGAPYIKVSSTKPVKEPFLDFLLTINWASGQMMREYTLLLDPPVFEKDQQVGRISAAATEPAQVVRKDSATATPTQQWRVYPEGSYGPTVRSDTLWAVAEDMRPDASISVPQMMLGLLKENPEAFRNNNINDLKAGYVLRQPEMQMITALSKQEAAAQANRQYQEWLAAKGKGPAVSGRQQRVASATPAASADSAATAPSSAAAVTPEAQSEARLQLLSPDEEARVRAGVGSGTSGESAGALRRELAIAQEAAEATRQENADLRARLDDLEQQLQSVQKLLTLKSDTLGALQADAQSDAQAEADTPASTPETQAEAADQTPAAPVAKKPAVPAAQPEPVQTSLLDEVLANPMYMAAGGGVIIVLLLLALIMRRRRQADDGDFTVMTPVVQPAESQAEEAAKRDTAAAEAVAGAEESATAAAEADEDISAVGDFGAGLGTIQAEESEIDPIAEADVYLAYRRYEQAEALLKEAIAADPGRHELKLKLLEIYHATKDADSFEAQAESLYAALAGQDEQMWSQAVHMGRELLPDHPLFSEGVAAASDADAIQEEQLQDFESELADNGTGEEVNFEDDEFVSDETSILSDDALAESLNLPGMDTESEAAGLEEKTGLGAETDELDVSLDDLGDLGDLDLDLDLESSDALELGATEDATLELDTDSEIALGELELGTEELTDVAAEDAVKIDNDVEDLSELLEESSDVDLGAELDAFAADEGKKEEAPADFGDLQELSSESLEEIADIQFEETEAVAETDLVTEVGDDLLDVDKTTSLEEEPAELIDQLGDQFGDLADKTDDLLETVNKDEPELDNVINLDDLSVDGDERVDDFAATLMGEETDVQAETAQEDFDPLADISNLAEMDFSELSDEDNDDIFDNMDDMVGTKLDLAKAYIDMGDQDGARSILDEVVEEGDDDQREEAEQLMHQIS